MCEGRVTLSGIPQLAWDPNSPPPSVPSNDMTLGTVICEMAYK